MVATVMAQPQTASEALPVTVGIQVPLQSWRRWLSIGAARIHVSLHSRGGFMPGQYVVSVNADSVAFWHDPLYAGNLPTVWIPSLAAAGF